MNKRTDWVWAALITLAAFSLLGRYAHLSDAQTGPTADLGFFNEGSTLLFTIGPFVDPAGAPIEVDEITYMVFRNGGDPNNPLDVLVPKTTITNPADFDGATATVELEDTTTRLVKNSSPEYQIVPIVYRWDGKKGTQQHIRGVTRMVMPN